MSGFFGWRKLIKEKLGAKRSVRSLQVRREDKRQCADVKQNRDVRVWQKGKHSGQDFFRKRNRRVVTLTVNSASLDSAYSSEQDNVNVKCFTENGVRVWILEIEGTSAIFIAAEAEISAPEHEVWKVATDYERYSEWLPNISESTINVKGPKTKVWSKMAIQSIYWRAEADCLLEVEEQEEKLLERKVVEFSMLEGDFDTFQGRWVIEPSDKSYKSLIRMEIEVESKVPTPQSIVDTIIQELIPSNVRALAKQAEQNHLQNAEANVSFVMNALQDVSVELPGISPFEDIPKREREAKTKGMKAHEYLGVYDVPIPISEGAAEQMGSEGAPEQETNVPYPPITLGQDFVSGVELHLRKLDDDEYIHYRSLASIEIKAPKEHVWRTLTDYEKLPSVMPNLAVSEKIDPPQNKKGKSGRFQLRQVVFKRLYYLCFRAEALLDVLEKEPHELQFRLRNGMFDKLQGKFILQSSPSKPNSTNLVYAVEIRAPNGTLQNTVIAPVLEKIAFEDVPANLAALREHMEGENVKVPSVVNTSLERPASSVLCSDFEVFKQEMIRTFGKGNKTMPKKEEFRSAGRFDLEKACYAHGGFSKVAAQVGWKMQYQRKPKDYWQRYENLRFEILDFIKEHNLDSDELPQRRLFIEHDRADIVRAYSKWGGQAAVAESMGLRAPSTKQQSAWADFCDNLAKETGLDGDDLQNLARDRYKNRGESYS